MAKIYHIHLTDDQRTELLRLIHSGERSARQINGARFSPAARGRATLPKGRQQDRMLWELHRAVHGVNGPALTCDWLNHEERGGQRLWR